MVPMRLQAAEIAAIREAVGAVFGQNATVRLFGSRTDDLARGGDIDLLIEVEPGQATLQAEAALRERIEPAVEDLRVDILLHERGKPLSPIERIALRDGFVL
jgi:predicted nucleotidyltransferase